MDISKNKDKVKIKFVLKDRYKTSEESWEKKLKLKKVADKNEFIYTISVCMFECQT